MQGAHAQIPGTWFRIHTGLNTLAILAAVTAFIIIFVRFGWIPTGRVVNTYTAHRGVGITAVAMSLVQVLLGILRPHLGTARRLPWKRAHQAWGWLTVAAGGCVWQQPGMGCAAAVHARAQAVTR